LKKNKCGAPFSDESQQRQLPSLKKPARWNKRTRRIKTDECWGSV
jgi:hypothetical protein